MIYYLLHINQHHHLDHKTYSYAHEQKIQDFLDKGMKMKQTFMEKLEEEKKAGEIEEEEKFSEEHSSQMEDEGQSSFAPDENEQNLVNISLDQISFFLTKALALC
mmetsp:Transcript_21654/g.15909  ORF Transcript_21654/g.15909 Transcript_21654/m.15909 type:complete len:105 (+) Transcript_21654:4258-4572(+)